VSAVVNPVEAFSLVIDAIASVVGATRPPPAQRHHLSSVRARYTRPPEEVWQAITDIEGLSTWRDDLNCVERLPDLQDGRPAWMEYCWRGKLPVEVVEWSRPHKFVTRITDESGDMPFGGTWTWHIRPIAEGTEVTIAENRFVRPGAGSRSLTQDVFACTRTTKQVLRALGRKFGETTEPHVV